MPHASTNPNHLLPGALAWRLGPITDERLYLVAITGYDAIGGQYVATIPTGESVLLSPRFVEPAMGLDAWQPND